MQDKPTDIVINHEGLEFRAASAEAEPTILDLDHARWLEYSRPIDIRPLIKRMLRDKILNKNECYDTTSQQPLGSKGGFQKVTSFRLTETGALKVMARSGTAKAVAGLDVMVRLFVHVRRLLAGDSGALPSDSRILQLLDSIDSVTAENAELRARIDLVDPLGPGVIGRPRAAMYILSPLREAARLFCSIGGDASDSAFRREFKELENEVRLHIHYPASREMKIENIPIAKFGEAQSKVLNIIGRARTRAKRLNAELDKRTAQLKMLTN